ncbi:MAG: OmpA family protein [Proteobacteria bacterium]|nr:OmpA family protein [Pseudomonadota bacterium]
MNKTLLKLSALAAAALLAACASDRTPPPELLAARDAVQRAQSDGQVLGNAPLELKRAGDSLRRADELNAKGEPLADVESAAYVARRQAETAMAVAQAKRNEDAIKGAEADRERARADARTAEARRAQAQAASAQADASAARQQATMAQQQASSARQQAMTAQQQADAAQAQADAARAQAAQAQASEASARQQTAELQQQLAELQAKPTDRGMLVTLGDVLFEFGRAEVRPTAQASLQKLAAYLQAHPERQVLIEGFTDSVGSDAANLALSQRRAEAVSATLAGMGVAATRIAVRGYGESYPIADNTTDSNRALNRRVEIYISQDANPVRPRG